MADFETWPTGTGHAVTAALAALKLAEPMIEVMHSITMTDEAERAMAKRHLAVRDAIRLLERVI